MGCELVADMLVGNEDLSLACPLAEDADSAIRKVEVGQVDVRELVYPDTGCEKQEDGESDGIPAC
jgi:hypothetical protein